MPVLLLRERAAAGTLDEQAVAEVRVISNGEPTPNDVVFATLWGALFFGEVPDHRSMLGAALVVSGAFLLGVSRKPAPAEPVA